MLEKVLCYVALVLSGIWFVFVAGNTIVDYRRGYIPSQKRLNTIRHNRKFRLYATLISCITFLMLIVGASSSFQILEQGEGKKIFFLLVGMFFAVSLLLASYAIIWKVELRENELVYTNYLGIRRVYSYDDVGLVVTNKDYRFYQWGQLCFAVYMSETNSNKILRFFNDYRDRKNGLPTLVIDDCN